jgi:hypothetical protein
MKIKLILIAILFTSNYFAQFLKSNDSLTKSNQLFFNFFDSTKCSNINYKNLKNINKVPRGFSMLESIFSVKDKGKFTVYRFIANDIGCVTHECESLDTLYWILIFKTNKKNQIKDGYFLFLSESEMSKEGRLFRMRRKHLFYRPKHSVLCFIMKRFISIHVHRIRIL